MGMKANVVAGNNILEAAKLLAGYTDIKGYNDKPARGPIDYEASAKTLAVLKGHVAKLPADVGEVQAARLPRLKSDIADLEHQLAKRQGGKDVDVLRALWPAQIGPVDETLLTKFQNIRQNNDTGDDYHRLDAGWRLRDPKLNDSALSTAVAKHDVDTIQKLFRDVDSAAEITWLDWNNVNGSPVARVLRGPASLNRARLLMYLVVNGAALDIMSGGSSQPITQHPDAKEFDSLLLQIVNHPVLQKANALERQRNKRATLLNMSRSRFQQQLAGAKTLAANGTFDGAWRAFLVSGDKAHFQAADRLAKSEQERRKMEYAAILAAGPERVFDLTCKDTSTSEKWTSGRQLLSDTSGGTKLSPSMRCTLSQKANSPIAVRHAYDVDIAGTLTVRKGHPHMADGRWVDDSYVAIRTASISYPSSTAASLAFEPTNTSVSRIIYGESVTTTQTEGVSLNSSIKTIRMKE